LTQKEELKRKKALFEQQQDKLKADEGWKEVLRNEQELEKFDKIENGLLPFDNRDVSVRKDGLTVVEQSRQKEKLIMSAGGGGGSAAPAPMFITDGSQAYANDPEGLKNLKKAIEKEKQRQNQEKVLPAFWVPSLTPDAKPERLKKPPKHCSCPEGDHPLWLKELIKVQFDLEKGTEEDNDDDKTRYVERKYQCSVCGNTFNNSSKATLLKKCGHVFCTSCIEKFTDTPKTCFTCSRPFLPKHTIKLQCGGTGFAGHGVKLEATKFVPSAWV